MEIKVNKATKYVDGFLFEQETGYSYFERDGEFFLSGDASEKQLVDALAAHNPNPPLELTISQKLASVGLSLEELKAALA